MLKILKRALLFLSFTIILGINTTVASAKINEKDNLKVSLQLEQVQGQTSQVKAKLKITNVGIRQINDINVKSIIPEGIKLTDNSKLVEEIDQLDAAESFEREIICEVEKKVSVTPEKPEIGTTPQTPTNNDKEQNKTTGNIVVTGDESVFICIAIALVLFSSGVLLVSKSKKYKKLLLLFLCMSLVSSMLVNTKTVQASESGEMLVKESIVLGEETYEFAAKVTFAAANKNVEPSGDIISRGEWIDLLIDGVQLTRNQEIDLSEEDFPFSDISQSQYKESILYALFNNIIGKDNGEFKPNEPATREFAIDTAIKALGFDANSEFICDDANEIVNLKEVGMAVSLGLISLEQNKFYPTRELTKSESDYILEGIKGIIKSTEIDEGYDNVFEYKDGVITLDDSILIKNNNDVITLMLNEQTKNLKENDIIVFSNNRPYKISGIQEINKDPTKNNIVVKTVDPEIEETLDYIDIQGVEDVDMKGFIPEEGVIVMPNNNPLARISIDEEGSLNGSGSIKFSVDKEISTHAKISGNIEIKIPKVSYKADIDVGLTDVDINNVYLKFLSEIKVTGGINISNLNNNNEDGYLTDPLDGIVTLGKVPVVGIPGVTVYAEIGLAYSIEGQISIVYTFNGENGIQIYNNKGRAIKNINSSFSINASVTGKIGPKVRGVLEICEIWDLIDFSLFGGAAGNAETAIHPSLICIDLSAYLFFDITALDDCKIKDWLGISYTWEVLNKDNSPIKKQFHFENFNLVSECTFGNGWLKGTVAEAGNRTNYIENALIQVYDLNDKFIKSAVTDSNGNYTIDIKGGTYRVKIGKAGYISFESKETITDNEEKFVQTYLMVEQGDAGEVGVSGGKIINAITGGNISNITLNIRNGWNNVSGNIISTSTTNNEGVYNVELPLGNYTIEMIKDGFITNFFNIFVLSGSTLNQNSTLVPNSSEVPVGDLRVVLTWGNTPSDLDSHLLGPTADGASNFHIYFGHKSYYENGIMYADLDLDDTTSYGPETTTVYSMNSSGKYSYYVHDYTNGSNYNSSEMSNSSAKVEVYKGDTLYATYNIPTNKEGIVWHVFDFDAEQNKILPINNITNNIQYENNETRNLTNYLFELEEKE